MTWLELSEAGKCQYCGLVSSFREVDELPVRPELTELWAIEAFTVAMCLAQNERRESGD
jgi:hypothetical protein